MPDPTSQVIAHMAGWRDGVAQKPHENSAYHNRGCSEYADGHARGVAALHQEGRRAKAEHAEPAGEVCGDVAMDARSLASEWTGDAPEDEERMFAAVMGDMTIQATDADREKAAKMLRELLRYPTTLSGPADDMRLGVDTDDIAQALAEAREEGRKQEWQRLEISRAMACMYIEDKYGAGSDVFVAVHAAFCGKDHR